MALDTFDINDFISKMGQKLGLSKPPGARPIKEVLPTPQHSSYLQDPDWYKKASPFPKPEPFQYEEPATEYVPPDQFERGEDLIQLLAQAEERSRTNPHPSGQGTKEGHTLFSTSNPQNPKLKEDEVWDYLQFLEGR